MKKFAVVGMSFCMGLALLGPALLGNHAEATPGEAAAAHQGIASYDGPQTCIECHTEQAAAALDSLHMQWTGPTSELTNTGGEDLGKASGGINTFCTYAMSSKGACFGCHVRADGNAPHPPEAHDVDCLMCHNDTYQRKFVSDPNNTVTVTNILGEIRTYVFGEVDPVTGDYTTVPDFDSMPAGTTMVDLARSVHLPTRQSCLRCHAKAGGGDWTKRGDMGLNSAAPTVSEDVHMSPDGGGANLSCSDCHVTDTTKPHLLGGRGIDLRQTEAPDPQCIDCHGDTPHPSGAHDSHSYYEHDSIPNVEYNRHAQGQVSCQVCHIRTFGKGGATEMSRDWLAPHWNPAFCAGQGGFVGHEVKVANVTPEYRWFDGTSYVYNVGETIDPNPDGTYTMAKANGEAFDGAAKIVPIKDHWTVMPLHESGELVPPAIYQMFMTGDFGQAVQQGMAEVGMTGGYTIVDANAEMLITHGVDPKSQAATCDDCHAFDGETVDGTKMLPMTALGFHRWPARVKNCDLCHRQKAENWEEMHRRHTHEMGKNCVGCHTAEPIGWQEDPWEDLCDNCHSIDKARDALKKTGDRRIWEIHEEHAESEHGDTVTTCTDCHVFP